MQQQQQQQRTVSVSAPPFLSHRSPLKDCLFAKDTTAAGLNAGFASMSVMGNFVAFKMNFKDQKVASDVLIG